jgi:hypothetical protein
MLSNNERLSFLIRKNIGRHKLNDFKNFFIDLDLKDLEYIDLEKSDRVRTIIANEFPNIEANHEMIDGNSSLKDSNLLSAIYNSSNEDDMCYIFIDEVELYGMFRANTRSSLNCCLSIAKSTFENTCFLTDSEFKFSFTINYYNEEDRYDKNKFDIQRKVPNEIKIK